MIDKLLAYQQEDYNLKQIENILSGSEEKKKAVSAKKFIETVEESVQMLEVKAGQLIAEFEKAQEDYNKIEEQQKELVSAIDDIEDENGASYLAKKNEELLNKIKNITADINRISGEIQSVLGEYKKTRDKFKAAKLQYDENGKKYSELKASKSQEMNEIKAKLEKLKAQVEPSLMEKYLKKREGKIFPIVYEVTSKVCGRCNMELPMAELNKLKNGEIIECELCKMLLYQRQK